MSPAVAVAVFALGLLAGLPIAIFGFEMLVENAEPLFTVLLGLFAFVVFLTFVIIVFRRPIWERLFRFGQVEMDRFAEPLADVARFAAEQNVPQATRAARDLAEMVLANYSWIITRRWLVATVTGFIAAIAALAGSALLFQQNQLLTVQNERITEQTELLVAQIELGEAQRSTSIVPELLAIGETLGEETAALRERRFPKTGVETQAEDVAPLPDHELSTALRARIIAASIAARPYRYLVAPLVGLSDEEITWEALMKRPDLTTTIAALATQRQRSAEIFGSGAPEGRLTDRVLSPERGQLIIMLYNSGVLQTEYLTFGGADFSFAEVRLRTLARMSFHHALLRHADFSGIVLHSLDFAASYIEGARFRRAELVDTSFAALAGEALKPPMRPTPEQPWWHTQIAGADFTGARIFGGSFARAHGLALDFDGALVSNTDFKDAVIGASTFRHAVLWNCDFSGAVLKGVDLDGAIVFRESFLEDLAKAAEEGTFVAERFVLEPLAPGDLAAHPQANYLWRVEGLEQAPAWRIRRVQDFG